MPGREFHIAPHWIKLIAVATIALGVYLFFFYLHPTPVHHKDVVGINNHYDTGTLIKFTSNELGDVDGADIVIDRKLMHFHFPPHTAQQIMNTFSPGDSVAVSSGPTGPAKAEHERLERIENIATGNSIEVNRIHPPPSTPGKEVVVSSSVHTILVGSNNELRGLELDNAIIELKPPEARRLKDLIHPSSAITVAGIEREDGNGFVNIKQKRVLRVLKITINGTTYSLQ